MATPNQSDHSTNDRNQQLKSVLEQLSSGRASEVWRGIDQVRLWLDKNIEDHEVYELLLDAVQKNRSAREEIRSLLSEMKGKASKFAGEALSRLPSNVQDLLADADDVYYAGDYKQAVELYRRVLRADPENARAKEQLPKAIIEVEASIALNPNIPREAVQYFRQARSYIAARDFLTAAKLLGAAAESAEKKGEEFLEAEQLLNTVQNLLIADSFKKRAYVALENNQWRDAIDLCNKALNLDPTNEALKKEIDSIQGLVQAEHELFSKGILKIFIRLEKLQRMLDGARMITNPNNSLLKDIEKQVNQIRLVRRSGIVFILVIVLGFFSLRNEILESSPIVPTLVETQTPVVVIIVPPITTTNTIVLAVTNTFTFTPTIISSTEKSSPTSTLTALGIGYIKFALVTARDNPNGKSVEKLVLYQTVTILEQKDSGGAPWYRCTWDSINNENGYWILAEYISLGRPPRPASTPTP